MSTLRYFKGFFKPYDDNTYHGHIQEVSQIAYARLKQKPFDAANQFHGTFDGVQFMLQTYSQADLVLTIDVMSDRCNMGIIELNEILQPIEKTIPILTKTLTKLNLELSQLDEKMFVLEHKLENVHRRKHECSKSFEDTESKYRDLIAVQKNQDE